MPNLLCAFNSIKCIHVYSLYTKNRIELIQWELTSWEVDLVGVDFVEVDFVGVALMGGHQGGWVQTIHQAS